MIKNQYSDNCLDANNVEAPDGRTFDVFISHTSEDKDAVVRPLASALQSAALSVW